MRHAAGRIVTRYTPGASIANAATIPLNSENKPLGSLPSSARMKASWPTSGASSGVMPMPTVSGRPMICENTSGLPAPVFTVSPCSSS